MRLWGEKSDIRLRRGMTVVEPLEISISRSRPIQGEVLRIWGREHVRGGKGAFSIVNAIRRRLELTFSDVSLCTHCIFDGRMSPSTDIGCRRHVMLLSKISCRIFPVSTAHSDQRGFGKQGPRRNIKSGELSHLAATWNFC
jgi:hypothetical protein